jgi:hypothetical protein
MRRSRRLSSTAVDHVRDITLSPQTVERNSGCTGSNVTWARAPEHHAAETHARSARTTAIETPVNPRLESLISSGIGSFL